MDICPFGPELQKYWDRRYFLFSAWDSGIQTDAEGIFSVKPESLAMTIAQTLPGQVVLDAFCGIGGSAIAFARMGKTVIAIDNHTGRIAMAKNNCSRDNGRFGNL